VSSDRLQLANLLSFERNLGRTDFDASADEYDVMELCVTVLNQLRWLTELGLMDQTDSVARASVAFRPALVEVLQTLDSSFDVSLAVGAVPLLDEIPGQFPADLGGSCAQSPRGVHC